MAQKKITDLQLISNITDAASWILDTGLQTYRASSLQLKNYVLAAGNVTRSALAVGARARRKITSYTSASALSFDDDICVLSGSSFDLTLPDASSSGAQGRVFEIIHNGTTATNIYTLLTTSSQTIGLNGSGHLKLFSKGEIVKIASNGSNWILLNNLNKRVTIRDERSASTTQAGTFTSGSYVKRTLQTMYGDTTFVSLSSSVFTLVPGYYLLEGKAQSFYCGIVKHKIRNTTDSTDVIVGIPEQVQVGVDIGAAVATMINTMYGFFEITSSKDFELQGRCSITRSTDGLGSAPNYGDVNVFAELLITKIR
jgi:hypothetical protein